jgi:beta-lactam-binding protein with PASTA domain
VIRFFRFLFVAMTLVLIATVSAMITMSYAIHGAEVKLPDFKGMSVAAARQKAATLNLNLSVEGRLFSTELAQGLVLTQAPAPDTIVRRGWQVRVNQSLGARTVAIPNVLGQQERVASISIRRLGLELGTIAHMPDAQVPPGTVIAQNPMPDAAGVDRPSVSILVADGDPTATPAFIMPDYTGKTTEAAEAELARTGLPPAQEREALPSPTGQPAGAPGTIVRQSPAPGERVTPDTPILFDVAR